MRGIWPRGRGAEPAEPAEQAASQGAPGWAGSRTAALSPIASADGVTVAGMRCAASASEKKKNVKKTLNQARKGRRRRKKEAPQPSGVTLRAIYPRGGLFFFWKITVKRRTHTQKKKKIFKSRSSGCHLVWPCFGCQEGHFMAISCSVVSRAR